MERSNRQFASANIHVPHGKPLVRQLHVFHRFPSEIAFWPCVGVTMLRRIQPHLSLTPVPMSYVVASKIKEFINAKGMMSAGDLAEHASKFLEEALAKAVKRAAANGRKTVRGEDL